MQNVTLNFALIMGLIVLVNSFFLQQTTHLFNRIHSSTKMKMCINENNQTSSSANMLVPISTVGEWLDDPSTKKLSVGIIPTGPENGNGSSNPENKFKSLLSTASPGSIKYFKIIENLAPNELLIKFAKTSPKNVQEAAKSTVMNIFGSLPNYALDSALITTNTKLANLLYQMQITGYMFKNAEYRMSLTKALKGLPKLPPPTYLSSGNVTFNPTMAGTKVSGVAKVETNTGNVVTVNVQDLTEALSKEVQDLRAELALLKNERENELKSNLLTYIQALPEKEMTRLTSDMSEEILQSIQLLVDAVMLKLGIEKYGPEVVIQQSVGYLAQICMWQMVVGYKLRELEAFDRGVPLD